MFISIKTKNMKNITYALVSFAIALPMFANAYINDFGGGYGMMGYGYGNGSHFFMTAAGIVWIIVGILAGVWLWQHIDKK